MKTRSRLGKIHGVSAIQFKLLISLTWADVIRVCAKVFSMPMKDDVKQDFLLKKKKTNAHRLTCKAYQFGNSNQTCRILGPKHYQQKLTSLLSDKSWKRTRKIVGNEAVAPLENSI